MATITISNLRPAGFDLFMDSETFITNLGDFEKNSVSGGTATLAPIILTSSKICREGIKSKNPIWVPW